MSATYGMPYHLEDTTGSITDSNFTDLHQRLSFTIRTTMRTADRSALMIYDASSSSRAGRGGLMVPVACLDFGANNALGTIKIGQGDNIEMETFLARVNRNTRARKFTATDGNEYTWTYTGTEDTEWTCTNSRGYAVASYNPKSEREPNYEHSSGCMLYIEESYPHLAGELLATLAIMRHIAKYNL
ncbi:hypothetical protein BDW22DRAFT_805162 [Trametopsis cervina]|nr:hypothetical protein BDW22DRAFT_805162 [Trametopsis cervina]